MKMYLPAVLLLSVLAASTNGQVLTVELDEADYSVDHGEIFFTGRVITSPTRTQEPIQILLLPLTITEYEEIYLVGPCNIPSDARPADSSDIDETPIVIEIPANPNRNNLEIEFQVPILPSTAVEAEETFLLLLNATNSDVEVGNQACSIVQLGASDPPSEVIRLERKTVEVAESSGFNHLFNVIKTVELEVPISLMLSASGFLPAQARPDVDFTLPTTTLRIEPDESVAQVNVIITDDSIAEDDEAFSLTVRASLEGVTFLQIEEAVVTIKDDEVIGFGLVDEEIDIFEGDDGQVCAEYHNTTEVEFDRFFNFPDIREIPLTMADGTAKGDEDYMTATNTYRFRFNPNTQCFRVQTIANDIQQPARYFTVNFNTSLASDVTKITPSSTRINIIDDDGPPFTPQIEKAEPGLNKTLPISWTAQSSRTNQTTHFTVTITVDGAVREPFNITNTSARDHILTDYQGEKEYSIVICAVNHVATACSDPFELLPTIVSTVPLTTMPPLTAPTAPPIIKTEKPTGLNTEDPVVSPGLIAGIVVIVVAAILLCCLFLLILFFCFCCKAREMAYYPGKNKGKELKGDSRSDSFKEEDDDEDDFSYSLTPEKIAF